MKFTTFATLFAALLVSGHAANPEANVEDAAPVAAVVDIVPVAAASPEGDDKRALRGDATKNHKQNRKMKDVSMKTKDVTGIWCSYCCDDDYHC